jgi:hypothetical protein
MFPVIHSDNQNVILSAVPLVNNINYSYQYNDILKSVTWIHITKIPYQNITDFV